MCSVIFRKGTVSTDFPPPAFSYSLFLYLQALRIALAFAILQRNLPNKFDPALRNSNIFHKKKYCTEAKLGAEC